MIRNGHIFYLVKWLGWDAPDDDTWEPEAHLTSCAYRIAQYQMNLPEFATVVDNPADIA
jgi:hypothetical protein